MSLLYVGIGEDVVVTAIGLAGRHDDITIGQFLALGLVGIAKVGEGHVLTGAQDVPCHTEVVGICHTVVHVLAPQGGIDAVVLAHLDLGTLEDTAGTNEEALCRVLVGTGLVTSLVCLGVPKAIELLGDIVVYGVAAFCHTVVSLATVLAVEACHTVGVLTCSTTADGVTRYCHKQHTTCLAVDTDGRVAKAVVAVP